MKRMNLSRQIKKALPVIVATSVLTACVGGQEGDTNGEFAGVGIGGGATTVLGVVGGLALAGALLADDDDSGSGPATVDGAGDVSTGGGDTATGGDTANGNGGDAVTGGDTGTGGTGGDTGTGGTGGDTGTGGTGGDTGTGGTGGDTGTGGTGGDTGTGGTGGDTGTGGTGGDTGTGGTGGDTGTGGTGGDTGTGGTGGDTGTGGTGGDTGTGGTGGDTGTGGTGGVTGNDGLILASDGSFVGEFTAAETTPASNSAGIGLAELQFDAATGIVTGCVTVPAGSASGPNGAVTLMIGPPGANGFPGIELEPDNGDRTKWVVPANLSAAQRGIVQQDLLPGNLYLAVRNDQHPNGELRAQITSPDVYQYTTTVNNADGSSANGFVLVNEVTGDYAITWNTSDPNLVSAHLNDGVVSGNSETVILSLSQRPSNPARFFAYGNFNDPNDPVPNLEALLSDGQAWLDAHSANDDRRFFGLLTKSDG